MPRRQRTPKWAVGDHTSSAGSMPELEARTRSHQTRANQAYLSGHAPDEPHEAAHGGKSGGLPSKQGVGPRGYQLDPPGRPKPQDPHIGVHNQVVVATHQHRRVKIVNRKGRESPAGKCSGWVGVWVGGGGVSVPTTAPLEVSPCSLPSTNHPTIALPRLPHGGVTVLLLHPS